MNPSPRKSKPEKIMLRVVKGGLQPADNYTNEKLRARGYKMGEIVAAAITKPRNPAFWGLAHRVGTLCANNLDDFTGMESHAALKRLQLEAHIECDEIEIRVPGFGRVIQFIPRSLSYESMDEATFDNVMLGISRHIASQYWHGVEPEAILKMAGTMVDE